MGRLSLFNVPGPRSGPFGPLTNGNLPPSPVSDDHPAPVPFKLHAQARLDEETGKPVIGPPAPDPPFPQRYTYRLNSYSLAPSDPSTIDGAQVERQEEANDEELTAFFEGEWGGVEIGPAVAERRSVTLKPKRVVRFRSFWMKHVEIKVVRWEDREGSTVTIKLEFLRDTPSVLHTLILDVNVQQEVGFVSNNFQKLKDRLRRWPTSEGPLPGQKRVYPDCTPYISPFIALAIPLPGTSLASFGPVPASFNPKDPKTWNNPFPPLPPEPEPSRIEHHEPRSSLSAVVPLKRSLSARAADEDGLLSDLDGDEERDLEEEDEESEDDEEAEGVEALMMGDSPRKGRGKRARGRPRKEYRSVSKKAAAEEKEWGSTSVRANITAKVWPHEERESSEETPLLNHPGATPPAKRNYRGPGRGPGSASVTNAQLRKRIAVLEAEAVVSAEKIAELARQVEIGRARIEELEGEREREQRSGALEEKGKGKGKEVANGEGEEEGEVQKEEVDPVVGEEEQDSEAEAQERRERELELEGEIARLRAQAGGLGIDVTEVLKELQLAQWLR